MPPRKISRLVDVAVEAVADRASDGAKARSEVTKLKGFKKLSAGSKSQLNEVIPSSMEVLNKWIFGCGGWPVKRVVEVFSEPSAGKTSLLIDGFGQCAKLGGTPIYIETERAMPDVERFTVLGSDPDDIWLSEPMSVEEALTAAREGMLAIPEGAGPNLMGFDSIGMAALKVINEKGQDAKTLGKKAALFAEHMPSIARIASETRTCLVLVNHQSTKIGVMFGDPTTTPGGDKNKFIASVRLRLWAGSKVKGKNDEKIGIQPTITTVKNKLAIPHRKAKLRLLFASGWDGAWSLMNLAKDEGVIAKDAKETAENLQRARAGLGWYTPSAEELEAWAALDAEAATKPKRGKKAITLEESEDDLFSSGSDWDGDDNGED